MHDVHTAALRARERRSLADVVEGVAAAATRMADGRDPAGARARELLERALGWSGELAGETLTEMARGWTREAMWGVLREELGDPGVLDGFAQAGMADGRRRRRIARGPAVLLQVHAGNVPGVGITGVVRGLLARSGVLARPSQQQPGLVALFARTLAAEDDLLGRCVATTWWPAGDVSLPEWRCWVKRCGKVVVYGGAEAVSAVRSLVPAHTDLLVYGPKVGVGAVLPDAGLERAAGELARDVCAYQQRGCVSPRLVHVLSAGEDRRREFAAALERALGDEVKRQGPRALTPAEAAGIRSVRTQAELGEDGPELRVMGDPEELAWTVISGPDGELRSEPWPRIVRVFSASDPEEWQDRLAPLEGRIQAVGYAGREGMEELARRAATLGTCRVAPFGSVAWPPAAWRHDGRHQLLPLLEWTDWELPEGRIT